MSNTEPDAAAAKIVKSNAAWRSDLTAEPYHMLRRRGTERPGTSPPNREKRDGVFACAGWASFDQPSTGRAVSERETRSLFMRRIEVRCDGHLGHVFRDGPRDAAGLPYCINDAELEFKPADS